MSAIIAHYCHIPRQNAQPVETRCLRKGGTVWVRFDWVEELQMPRHMNIFS